MKLHKFATFDDDKPTIMIYVASALYQKTLMGTYFGIYFKYFHRVYGKTHNVVLSCFSCTNPRKSIIDAFDGAVLGRANIYKDLSWMQGKTYYEIVDEEMKAVDFKALKIEKLFVINQLFFPFLRKPREKIFDVKIDHKFAIVVKTLIGITGAAWLNEKAGLHINQLVIDPDEVFLDSYGLKTTNWFFYDSPTFNCKALHIVEDHYQHDRRFKMFTLKGQEKIRDVMIGYTKIAGRKTMRQIDFNKIREQVKPLNHKVLCKDKDTGEDSFVPKEEYDQLILESKCTLVFPSYNVKAFSTIRFLDSIANRCIPLILDTCATNEMFRTQEEKDLAAKLIVTEDTLHDRIIELRDSPIIHDLYRVFIEQKSITRTISK